MLYGVAAQRMRRPLKARQQSCTLKALYGVPAQWAAAKGRRSLHSEDALRHRQRNREATEGRQPVLHSEDAYGVAAQYVAAQ
jgi:hypothetical protein